MFGTDWEHICCVDNTSGRQIVKAICYRWLCGLVHKSDTFLVIPDQGEEFRGIEKDGELDKHIRNRSKGMEHVL